MAVLHSHHSGTDHQRPHGLGCPKLNAARFGKGAARLAAGQRPAPAGIFELLTDRYGHCVAAVGPVPQKPRCLPRTAAGATFNCCVLGTLLVAASQNYNLLQSIGFGFGSGVGYLVAVLVVDEGRRRLRSKDIPHIFRGLPSVLIYIGILSLAIYGLVGTVD